MTISVSGCGLNMNRGGLCDPCKQHGKPDGEDEVQVNIKIMFCVPLKGWLLNWFDFWLITDAIFCYLVWYYVEKLYFYSSWLLLMRICKW